jgi:signal transduction histidine kinase
MNLCVNARDAMPEGGQLTIQIDRRTIPSGLTAVMGDTPAAGDYIVISVRDNGTGIPAHILPKLFDPFFSTKPKDKGTGLGLATVIRLVRRHKGFVTLETALGQGTCFRCHFPIEANAG